MTDEKTTLYQHEVSSSRFAIRHRCSLRQKFPSSIFDDFDRTAGSSVVSGRPTEVGNLIKDSRQIYYQPIRVSNRIGGNAEVAKK